MYILAILSNILFIYNKDARFPRASPLYLPRFCLLMTRMHSFHIHPAVLANIPFVSVSQLHRSYRSVLQACPQGI